MNTVVYLVILLAFFILIGFSVKPRRSEDAGISKETSNVLKGYAIIVIMLHHMVLRMSSASVLLPFRIAGYLGVSIFFFLSGYGLFCAANGRETQYASGFMLKRLQRVYIPAVFLQLVYMLVLVIFFHESFSIPAFLSGLFVLYPVDSSQWYIIAAFYWYLVFWLLIRFMKTWKIRIVLLFAAAVVYIAICALLHLQKNWIDTAFCFPMGVAYAAYRDKLHALIQRYWIPIAVLTFGLFGVTVFFSFGRETTPAIILRTISSICSVVLLLIGLRFVDLQGNRPAAVIGAASLECYLVHGKVIRVMKSAFGDVQAMEALIYIASTAVLVIAFSWLLKKYTALCNPSRTSS